MICILNALLYIVSSCVMYGNTYINWLWVYQTLKFVTKTLHLFPGCNRSMSSVKSGRLDVYVYNKQSHQFHISRGYHSVEVTVNSLKLARMDVFSLSYTSLIGKPTELRSLLSLFILKNFILIIPFLFHFMLYIYIYISYERCSRSISYIKILCWRRRYILDPTYNKVDDKHKHMDIDIKNS